MRDPLFHDFRRGAVMADLPDIAISVRQPWAWAILHAGKDVENRVKRAITMGGMKPGRIALHASQTMTRSEYESARVFMCSIGVTCPSPDTLPRGGIVGAVTVREIVSSSDSDWFFGPWALVLGSPEACAPIPAKGQLGFFRWTPSGAGLSPVKPWMESTSGPPCCEAQGGLF